MRAGLDADDRDSREQVFGKNLIDIQQKSVFQLLMDEVPVHRRSMLDWHAHCSRLSTHSISSNLLALSSGRLTSITITLSASFPSL